MDTLKNLTVVQWIGICVGLNSLLLGSTQQLTVLFGAQAVPYIGAIATLLNGALGVFVTVVGGQGSQVKNVLAMPGVDKLSVNKDANATLATIALDQTQDKAQPVPGAKDALTTIAKTAASVLFALIFLSMLAPSAFAQTKTLKLPIDPLNLNGTPVTGNAAKDMQAIWQKLIAASNTDLTYASALASSAGTPASKQRKQCWDAIIKINTQANNAKNVDGTDMQRPDPHLFTDIETQAEIVDSLSPQGDLFTSCAGAAEMAKMSALQFINAVITGAAGFAAVP